MESSPVVVVGNGWTALAAVTGFIREEVRVRWITGTGARVLSPLPVLGSVQAAEAWRDMAASLGIEAGEIQTGSWIREFKNKTFREPAWARATSDEERLQVRDENLWAPEQRWVGVADCRLEKDLFLLEWEMREAALASPLVEITSGVPVVRVEWKKDQLVALASGEVIRFERLVYADKWSQLRAIEGFPKRIEVGGDAIRTSDVTSRLQPKSVLQLALVHPRAGEVAAGSEEGFMIRLPREAGEEFERSIWGYFFDGGRRSLWTVLLAPSEAESNHEVAKKLRRMKQTLNKAFVGPEWTGGASDFLAMIEDESVHFEEGVIFAHNLHGGIEIDHPVPIDGEDRVILLADGFGFVRAIEQVARLFSAEQRAAAATIAHVTALEPESSAEAPV